MSLRFRIALSAACAVLSLLAFWSYGAQVRKEADQVRQEAMARYGGEVVGVVVPTRTLEAGEQVGMADVTSTDWLVDLVPQGCLTSIDEVIGMTVTVPAAKGAPLTSLNFRDTTEARDIPEGRVAVAVSVSDRTAVPREVGVGSVLAAYALDDLDVRLISADLLVLSSPGEGSVSRGDSSLSLAAWPDQVTALLLASARGELRLVLPAEDARAAIGDAPGAVADVEVEVEASDGSGEDGAGEAEVPEAPHDSAGDSSVPDDDTHEVEEVV